MLNFRETCFKHFRNSHLPLFLTVNIQVKHCQPMHWELFENTMNEKKNNVMFKQHSEQECAGWIFIKSVK